MDSFNPSIFGSIIPKKHKNNPYYLPGSVAKLKKLRRKN
jgi:hypothetical protein